MNDKYGSNWNKWDFHVHTPYSILNNGYGPDPFEMADEEVEKMFDTYVQTLFKKALEKGIMGIGITDYFLLDGYKRIVNHYLQNPNKMATLFPDKAERDRIKQIYIFPNIELRLDKFVGKNSKSVNYHVLFSASVPIQDIEENFLYQLKFRQGAGAEFAMMQSNIRSYGRTIKEDNGAGESGSDLFVGLKHLTLDDKTILGALSNPKFAGKYLISIPVDEDLSLIPWNGRDYTIRKSLYEQCNCYMTSNEKTILWALAEGEEEERKKEFGSIKPCIWGSDAHKYDEMFRPANDKFCWIKADLSFEGLSQILYEPKERVAIQRDCPNKKDAHQIIKSIQFEDPNFQTSPIVFNDGLTCIIGGKSTGKSLLIHQLAYSIDPSYAEQQEKESVYRQSKFPVTKAIVTWKDGTTDSRKIVYIPQTFLNRTIDNQEQSTAIDKIIEDVLQQEPEISTGFFTLKDEIKGIRKSVQAAISDYCEESLKLETLEDRIKQEGTSTVFTESLKNLENERKALANKVNLTQEEIARYADLENLRSSLKIQKIAWDQEQLHLKSLLNPSVVIPKYFSSFDGISISHFFEKDFPQSNEQLQKTIKDLSAMIQPNWEQVRDRLISEIESKIVNVQQQIDETEAEYKALNVKVKQNEQLQNLNASISAEHEKLQAAIKREKERLEILASLDSKQRDIISSSGAFFSAYVKYCDTVNRTGTKKDTSLIFSAQPIWKQRAFQSCIGDIFDNRNYASFSSHYNFDLFNLTPEIYSEEFLNALWTAMTNPQKAGALTIKAAHTMESALQQIFGDWYNIHYVVKSGEDKIEEMSPGKKALVLLELLISLKDSQCPILIDQPEDDLDNRSIYDDLVQYIKKKKKERQIIVVTHNANVVLGADAEEIIIANQTGKGTENASKRFEYRSGAIENDTVEVDAQGKTLPGILNSRGLQTQICDILEGGRLAFELRQNKYMAVPSR